MDYFNYREGSLFAEDVKISEIAQQFGTPCYVYSRATLERHYRAYDDAFGGHPHRICYAVKANSNLGVLSVLARLGAGFDIVSVGELERVLAAGGDASKVVFSGVGKQPHEIQRALEVGVHCFNIESEPELERVNAVALEMGKVAPISIRVNPDVDAKTHPYISTGLKENKFGIDIELAPAVYQKAKSMPGLNIIGVDCHIGSQLTEIRPFLDALDRVLLLVDQLKTFGIHLHHIDLGGGLGVRYHEETPPEPSEYAHAVIARLQEKAMGDNLELVMEPGRSIAANAGVMLTQVEFLKCTEQRHFAIVDAAMNDLIRPSLYGAWQAIIPAELNSSAEEKIWDIVGPVCETGDFIGKQRKLKLNPGDFLAVRSAGAYGFAMSSNYNGRNRPAEVMVDGDKRYLVRERETIEHQMAGESVLP
jgi:diaminopimelate decarboxylase